MSFSAAETAALTGKLVVGLEGSTVTVAERQWLQRYQPAGVILFSRNVASVNQLEDLCRQLKDILGTDAEIVADHEGGAVSVLAAALGRPPAPYGLGLLDDPDLTRQVHHDTAVLLRDVGVDRVLAPCADVLVESRNPVIGARAFGSEAQLVARHVTAAVTGLLEGRVDCCLKHWPGHGGTRRDSHLGPVQGSLGTLDLPFEAGLKAGADALLVGHIPWPCSETAGEVPATLDPQALSAARHLGPSDSVRLYADDVTMGALQPGTHRPGLQDPARLPVSWFAPLAVAGCDVLLCRGIPWAAFPEVSAATSGSTALSRPPADTIEERGVQAGNGSLAASGWPASYTEARRRLVAASALGSRPLPDLSLSSLLWWDATLDDRWGDATSLTAVLSGQSLDWQRFGPGLEPVGSISLAASHGAVEPISTYNILLVTCHRPLDLTPLQQVLPRSLAATGQALVLGHPSLSRDIEKLIPEAWSVSAGFDIGPEDLQVWLKFQS